jgi:hypothetical protein
VTVHLGPLIVDAADPEAVTTFRESALGESSCRRHLVVLPQRRAKIVKNRVHLDVYARDVAPPMALGAWVVADYLPERVTLADVEGNEFARSSTRTAPRHRARLPACSRSARTATDRRNSRRGGLPCSGPRWDER